MDEPVLQPGGVAELTSSADRGTQATFPTPRLGYQPWLDGMRAVAVLAVMFFHEQLLQPTAGLHGKVAKYGLFGVDVFFVISGFLITTLLLQEIGRHGRVHFGAFYQRRARRLLPALGLLLGVIVFAAFAVQHGKQRTSSLHHVLITVLYVANWAQATYHVSMHELGHCWSLACEEQYYLLWPALLTGLVALGLSRRALIAVLGVATSLSCAYPVWAERRGWSFDRVYFGLDTHSCGLLVGSLLGVAYASGLLPSKPAWVWVRRLLAAFGALVVCVLIEDERVVTHLPVLTPGDWLAATYAMVSLGTAALIWELASAPPHFGHRVLGWSPLRAIGRISYALYLFGSPVIFWLTPKFLHLKPSLVVITVQLAVTFSLAIASWFGVERFFLHGRTRQGRAGVPS